MNCKTAQRQYRQFLNETGVYLDKLPGSIEPQTLADFVESIVSDESFGSIIMYVLLTTGIFAILSEIRQALTITGIIAEWITLGVSFLVPIIALGVVILPSTTSRYTQKANVRLLA